MPQWWRLHVWASEVPADRGAARWGRRGPSGDR